MGVFEWISQEVKGALNHAEIKTQMHSIAAEASKSIYYFPVLCSKNIDQKNAMMIVTNLESAYASFIQACFSMMPAVQVGENGSASVDSILKNFHQNIGVSSKNSLYLSFREAFEEYKLFPNESLNEVSSKNIVNVLDRAKKIHTDADSRLNGSIGVSANLERNPDGTIKYAKNGKPVALGYNSTCQWKASLIDKKNELRPTVVLTKIKFAYANTAIDTMEIPVGVKAVMHPVEANALTEKIMDSVAGKGILHNLIRYTTGEMLSLTDIVFGIKKMKKNIAGKDDIDKWSDALDHRKRLNSISKAGFAKKPFLPNVSIVISMQEIDEIQRITGYNLLTDTRRTIKFMEDNFILSFAVADDQTETMYVMYDGHSKFEEYPYSAVQKENQKNEKLVNALIKTTGAMIR